MLSHPPMSLLTVSFYKWFIAQTSSHVGFHWTRIMPADHRPPLRKKNTCNKLIHFSPNCVYQFSLKTYTEKTIFPFPFKLGGFHRGDSFSYDFLNQMKFHLVQNQKENCRHDHIPFNGKVNGNIVFSVCMSIKTTPKNKYRQPITTNSFILDLIACLQK